MIIEMIIEMIVNDKKIIQIGTEKSNNLKRKETMKMTSGHWTHCCCHRLVDSNGRSCAAGWLRSLPKGSSRLGGGCWTWTGRESGPRSYQSPGAPFERRLCAPPLCAAAENTEARAAMAESSARAPPVNDAAEIRKRAVRQIFQCESSRGATFFNHVVSSLKKPVAVRISNTANKIINFFWESVNIFKWSIIRSRIKLVIQ